MTKVTIREAQPGDDAAIWADLRQSDIDELMATFGRASMNELTRGLNSSDVCWYAEIDGNPAALFGAVTDSALLLSGTPWLLGTTQLDDHRVVFARRSRRYIRYIASRYAWLANYVDVRNEPTIKWLKWLGFTLHDPEINILTGMPLMKFTMKGAR